MEYEEYMRNVLGYNQIPNNMYVNTYDNYYYDTQYSNSNSVNNEIIEAMYPEIYRIIYPMIKKICMQNGQRDISRNMVESMTEEIYNNMEQDDLPAQNLNNQRTVLKNGDVRNPNVKEPETRGEVRQGNFLLKDLIKILILRELGNKTQWRPQRPVRPPYMPQMLYDQRPPLWR